MSTNETAALGIDDMPRIDVIYYNMRASPNVWKSTRQFIGGRVEDQFLRLANQIRAGCWDRVISVSASKYSFSAIVTTSLTLDELHAKGFSSSRVRESPKFGEPYPEYESPEEDEEDEEKEEQVENAAEKAT